MRCSCHHEFAPSAATYVGTQHFTDLDTGHVWLILVCHNCPACGSTRTVVMHEDIEDAESLDAIAAE